MEIVLNLLQFIAGLVLFYVGFVLLMWTVLAMARLWYYVKDYGNKNKKTSPLTSVQLRAYEVLTNDNRVFDVYTKLQNHPYIKEPHPAAKSNNAYRTLLQQKLRKLVPDKVVRVTIYDMANKKRDQKV